MFTAAQWLELEQQALIFKYMMAGIPVPPDLLLPIRKSFDAMPSRLYHHSPLGYCSFYGKKIDPEPGRCRRTDGKKWRCSKDAYPDSKYCERHMHRGRSRSRKPVETQTLPQSQSPSSSSTVTSLTPTGASSADNRAGGGTFRNLHSAAGAQNLNSSSGPNLTKLQVVDRASCSVLGCKDIRYLQGVKADGDEHCFSGASGNARNNVFDSSLDNTWRLTPPHASFSLSKGGNDFELPSSYSHLQLLPDLGHDSISSLSSQQHCFFGTDFGSSGPLKQESQSLRPFFDDCPKTSDSWAGLDEERANGNSFSTTKLSISIPMASSDFSTTSSRSPNDD